MCVVRCASRRDAHRGAMCMARCARQRGRLGVRYQHHSPGGPRLATEVCTVTAVCRRAAVTGCARMPSPQLIWRRADNALTHATAAAAATLRSIALIDHSTDCSFILIAHRSPLCADQLFADQSTLMAANILKTNQ
mmetsp:Transcript_71908/g.142557  ORF Transcript_71908/g.142557 Transcript_71908/m.142557 type:complete len:136 (-) Transcript_71908:1865-2272(-)